MLRLVQLELVEGKTVWLNPERVTMVASPHMEKGGTVIGECVILSIGVPAPLIVKCSPEEAIRLLTAEKTSFLAVN